MTLTGEKKVKVLVLDGGGVKGLSSLLILERIMARVGAKMKKPDLQPCEYFDIIGGTSTGGIIALMLGRMRMPVERCIAEYQHLTKIVFGNPRGNLSEFMFDAKILEIQTKAVIKKYLGDENAPLLDPLGEDSCKTVVYTLPFKGVNSERPEELRTYLNENVNPRPKVWTIWEAVRATSAATTIFEPFIHGQAENTIRYIDAGLGFNNPSDLVLDEVRSLWSGNGYLNLNHSMGCFLSIGTGIGDVVKMDNDTIVQAITAKVRKPLKAVGVMKAIATRTEPIHRNVAQQFDPISEVYQRFNVDQGLQAVKLFDYEKREEIEVDTSAYLGKHSVGLQLARAVEKMKTLGVQTPELLEDRKQQEEIYSTGESGDTDEQKLKARLKELRIRMNDFDSHLKYWESKTSTREGSKYYYTLYQEIGSISYMWNALVQVDLLDKRGRVVLARRLPHSDENQLYLSGEAARIAYGTGQEDLETTVTRLTLAYQQLRGAFCIYRQLFHNAQEIWGETSVSYCWIAKRLASLLELWGCLNDARNLYIAARIGKLNMFGLTHWSVGWLDDKISELHQAESETRRMGGPIG